MNSRPGGLDTEQDTRGTGRAGTLVGLVGILATILVVSITIDSARQAHYERLDSAGREAIHGIEEVFELAEDRLEAIGGLYGASDFVSASEFGAFVDGIGLTPGMSALGLIVTVPSSELAEFVDTAASQHDSFFPFGLDSESRPLPLDLGRGTHDFIMYAAPRGPFDQMVGLDIASLPTTKAVLEEARNSDTAHATPPFEASGQFTGTEFLLFVPIRSPGGEASGFAAALMDLDVMVAGGMSDYVRPGDTVLVGDVTGEILDAPGDASWLSVFTVAGRQWEVRVVPSSRFVPFTSYRIGGLVLGLMVSFGAAALLSALVETRRSRVRLEQMQMATQQTDRLLAVVSHELRTPLTAVVGFLEELRTNWAVHDDPDRLELVTLAGAGAEEIGSLIADLLVRERILSGSPLAAAVRPTSVGDEIDHIVMGAPEFGDVTVESGSSLVVSVDPLRLRQILRNLVSNAYKHGRPPVRISLFEGEDTGRVVVADDGPGVRDCCLATVFELGAPPCEGEHHQRVDSNGFGLPVSRFIARSMGGDLAYDAKRKEFELTFPLAYVSAVPSHAA